MKNKIIVSMTVLALLLMISNIMAVEYFQTKENMGNNTLRNRIFVYYNPLDATESFIKDGYPLEIVVNYRSYVNTWNQLNPQNAIDHCNITINYFSGLNNLTTTVLQTNFSNVIDYETDQYFFRLYPKDSFSSEMDCLYEITPPITLEMPVEQSISSPTNACKSCQYYKWTVQERKIIKAQNLGDKTVVVVEYIKQLFIINFEIVAVLFWIALIILLLASIGLIFFGMSYIIFWLWRHVK
jgi:hypothetical protein